jgi:hypothetical protein
MLEQRTHEREQFRRGREAFEQSGELGFDPVAPDGFAFLGAALGEAQIIGVPRAGLAFGPCAGDRALTRRTNDRAAQGEVGIEIGARGHVRVAPELLLDALKSLERDEGLVLRFAQRDAPLRVFQISRIERLGQNVRDQLRTDLALGVLRESGRTLKEALHFRLCLEPAGGVAFHRFRND